MNESKKTIEIIVIVLCIGFIIYKFGIAGRQRGGVTAVVERIASFDLEAAKKLLKDLSKEPENPTYKEFKNLLARPSELLSLEEEMIYGKQRIDNQPAEPTEELTLEGIIWGGKSNMAIISGKVVTEGDNVKGAKVLRILPEKVIVLQNGSQIELKR